MLRFLLDEHISPVVAEQLSLRLKHGIALALPRWKDGLYLSANDEDILRAAYEERLSLVTYDNATITPLIRRWTEDGRSHSGVIFIHDKTFSANNIGQLVIRLEKLWIAERHTDWLNRAVHLR